MQSPMNTEDQLEMENKLLHVELEKLKVYHKDDIQRCEIDVYGLKQLVGCLQWEIEQANKEIKEKDDLVANSEKLQKSLQRSQQHLECELSVEKDRNKALQQELEELKVLYNKDHLQYETELIGAEQSVQTLQRELQREIQKKALFQKEYEELQEIQRSRETFTAEIQAVRERIEQLQENRQKALSEEMPSMQQETIQEVDEVSGEKLPETNKKPSFWKRVRHFLGLRKPQKWKKKKE